MDADVEFDEAFDLTQNMVAFSLGRRLSERHNLHLTVGGILGGALEGAGSQRHDLSSGLLLSLQWGVHIFHQDGAIPFLNGSLIASAAKTESTPAEGGPASSLLATDVRLSVVSGWTLGEWFTVHGAVRQFGGPILWDREDKPGTGHPHTQLAVGSALRLPAGLRLFAEWAFYGERAITAGVGGALPL